jgi:hypothetical protein
MKKEGWNGRYQRDLKRLSNMNHFKDLETFFIESTQR